MQGHSRASPERTPATQPCLQVQMLAVASSTSPHQSALDDDSRHSRCAPSLSTPPTPAEQCNACQLITKPQVPGTRTTASPSCWSVRPQDMPCVMTCHGDMMQTHQQCLIAAADSMAVVWPILQHSQVRGCFTCTSSSQPQSYISPSRSLKKHTKATCITGTATTASWHSYLARSNYE